MSFDDNRLSSTDEARVQMNVSTGSRSITVQLFAGAAAAVGTRQIEIQLADNATVAELSEAIGANYPQLQPLLLHSRWAIGDAFIPLTQAIAPDERRPVAMIPPVSGG